MSFFFLLIIFLSNEITKKEIEREKENGEERTIGNNYLIIINVFINNFCLIISWIFVCLCKHILHCLLIGSFFFFVYCVGVFC